MKFSLGDRVLLKRTGEEGFVTEFISDILLEVEVGGIRFPVYIEDVDHPYLKWFTEKKKAPKKSAPENLPVEKEALRKARLARGIYLSFFPVYKTDDFEDIIDHLKIYLVNETASSIIYSYEVRAALGGQLFNHEARLHPFGNVYLHLLSLEEMNGQPRFHWSLQEVVHKGKAIPVEGLLRIRPAKLVEQISLVQQNNEASFSFLLTEDVTTGAVAKEEMPAPLKVEAIHQAPAAPKWQPCYELDLHIERLVADVSSISPAEMMKLQLDTLQYHLDLAVANGQDHMIVIHGIGKGVLREEVHRILGQQEGVESFRNDWHGRYGYGATEVRFKK